MAKTLKSFLEVYKPKSKDDQEFVDKHVTIKHKDRNGNGDDVFKASNVKTIKRSKEGPDFSHGYDPGQDEAVYEALAPHVHSSWSDNRDPGKGGRGYLYHVHLDGSIHGSGNTRHNKKFKSPKVACAYLEGKGFTKNQVNEATQRDFKTLPTEHLQKWLEKNDTDEPGKSPVYGAQIKAARNELSKRKIHEDLEQIDEISPELRGNWLHKTWKKHLRHVDDTPEQIKNGKPEMPAARQKIFGKADAKQNAHYKQKSKEDHAKKLAAHTPKVHDLRHMSHGDVYDHTQTSEKVKDGDVLHVKGGVAAMVQAWPVMIHGHSKTLHKFKEGTSIHTTDNGIYKKTGELADKIHKGLKEDWSTEEVDALLNEAFEKIEEGLTEAQLDEAADIAAALMEEFEGLDEAEAYSIAVASVTGVDLDEEAEDLDELSRSTLGDYATKAVDATHSLASAADRHAAVAGEVAKQGNRKDAKYFGNSAANLYRKSANRAAGAKLAVHKLATEEVEQLEEGVGVKVHSFAHFKREAQDLADNITHDGKVHFHTKEVSAGGKTWHQTSSNIHNMRNGGFYSYGHFNHTGKGASEEGHGRHVTAFELDEEAQLSELSNDTMMNYTVKAGRQQDKDMSTIRNATSHGEQRKAADHYDQRRTGVNLAHKKMADNTIRNRVTKEDIIKSAIDRFLPEDYELPALEDRLVKKLEGLSENNIGALVGLFRSLNSVNQEVMYEECDTKEGINKLLDLTIEARGNA